MTTAVANRLAMIRNVAGVRDREVAELLDTTPQTISRWNQGKAEPQPDTLERLLELGWLVDRLSEVCKPDEARLWLYSRHRLLNGERPVEMIRRGQIAAVLQVVAQLIDGAYA